ncbi:MAG: hypothetical protein MMC33_004513 [Icmadophila ericetorum]|nr:hypothetical protein [Icmadophila ericetorum]
MSSTSSSTPSAKLSIPPSSRQIVSSFILLNPNHPSSPLSLSQPSTYLILLFKRSSKVRVYKYLWAACSGSIDAELDTSPWDAAIREIREETGLEWGKDYKRVIGGEGSPREAAAAVEIDDKDVGTKWKIYLFVWELLGGKSEGDWMGKIRLDWEHTECRFVRLGDVDGMETVGHLGKNLRRALEGEGGRVKTEDRDD